MDAALCEQMVLRNVKSVEPSLDNLLEVEVPTVVQFTPHELDLGRVYGGSHLDHAWACRTMLIAGGAPG